MPLSGKFMYYTVKPSCTAMKHVKNIIEIGPVTIPAVYCLYRHLAMFREVIQTAIGK